MHNTLPAETLLGKGLKELLMPFSPEQVQAFLTYLAELKKWNKAYNLTALKTDEDIVIKHFLDSLLYLKAMPEGELTVMDVGSGAGFPGIPIKIIRPELIMYLVEPSRKKANFLRQVITILHLDNIAVVEKKLEDLELMDVDIAVTRALFDMKDFCAKASPVLQRGGMLILSKGPKVKEELKAFETENLIHKILEATLPLTDIKRFLVIIKQNTPVSSSSPKSYATDVILKTPCICINAECRMRKAGCRGFEWCPGFKSRMQSE